VSDFLALQAHQVGPFDAVYDRASIVALPAAMQQAFVGSLDALMGSDSCGLLLSFEYPVGERQGPPFSTDEACLRSLLPERVELNPITRTALAPEEVARFNVSWCFEAVYTLAWS
jgi:thiopurine S-methyltransferase